MKHGLTDMRILSYSGRERATPRVVFVRALAYAQTMIRADLHNHTLAAHGQDTVNDMYKAASKRHVDWYGLSEHSPLPPGYSCPLYKGDLNVTFPAYVEAVLALKDNALPGGPRVLLGMELDWLPVNMGWMESLLGRYPFDYVIGGLHFVHDVPIGSPRSWGEGLALPERFARYEAYYEEMARLAASGFVDVVAHPDFIKVCCYDDFQDWLRQPGSLDIVARALEAMRQQDVAMEVSSAGLRKAFHEPYPGPAIMGLAADLGLDICFGSDAHAAAETVSHFDDLARYARSYGFSRNRIAVGRERRWLEF